MQVIKIIFNIFLRNNSKMKYFASLLFAVVFSLVILTEFANCDPEAEANADPFFFGGGGFGRGFGGGYGRGGYGREGGGYGRGGYGGYGGYGRGYGWGR
jgi:uncharacterized membrane protein